VIDLIKKLFEYDNWATERELTALEQSDNPEALKMLGHILAARQIWLVRLNGQDSSAISTQPCLSIDECRKLAAELAMGYAKFFSSLDTASLNASVTYKNTKGHQFTTPVSEVLTHIAFHGAYHRGQIALLLRQNGDTAINTDFITFTRL
jgi:uncharacterized damage-inducible protein DinB